MAPLLLNQMLDTAYARHQQAADVRRRQAVESPQQIRLRVVRLLATLSDMQDWTDYGRAKIAGLIL